MKCGRWTGTPRQTTSFQFRACNSRPWNEAIGVQLGKGEAVEIYTCTCPFFSQPEGFFFLSRPLGSARYLGLYSFYQNYLVHWFIPFLSLSLSFSLAYDGTLCDQRRNHRAWISTRYRLSPGRQRIDDEPIKFIIFAGKAEQVDVSKRDPGVDCGYLPDDCSFRYTKQLSDCFHAFAWSLKRIYAGVYMYKFETVWNCLKSIDD